MASSVPYFSADEMEHNPFEENDTMVPSSENDNTNVSTPIVEEQTQPPSVREVESSTTISPPPPPPPPKDTAPDSTVDQLLLQDKILPEIKYQSSHYFKVEVISLERVGSTSNKRENPTIIFQYETNLPLFRRKRCNKVKKTLEEFKSFYKWLNNNVLECLVPVLPLPYTHYGINNQEDYEDIMYQYQIWFNRVVNDPLIINNEEFIFFIESDFNTYTPVTTSISDKSGSETTTIQLTRYEGIRRKTMKQFPPPYDNNLTLAEFRPLIKSIYKMSQLIQDCMFCMNKNEGQLNQEETNLGKQFMALDNTISKFYGEDVKKGSPFEKYGKIMITVNDINSVLGTMTLATLYDGLSWIINDTYGVKESLTDRQFVMRDLMNLQKQSKMKHERARKNRNKRDVDPIKLDESIRDLQKVVKLEQKLTLKLQRMTMNMEIERERWLDWYDSWMKRSVKEYVLKHIEYERKKLNVMERARYGIRSIDVQNGLSRLNREHLTHESVADKRSQQRDNDLWTTTDRHYTKTNEIIEPPSASPSSSTPPSNNNATTEDDNSTTTTYDPKTAVRFLGRANFA